MKGIARVELTEELEEFIKSGSMVQLLPSKDGRLSSELEKLGEACIVAGLVSLVSALGRGWGATVLRFLGRPTGALGL